MAIQLVVTHAFGPYATGDHITDQDEVAKWGASHPAHVVRKAYDLPAMIEDAVKAAIEPVAVEDMGHDIDGSH